MGEFKLVVITALFILGALSLIISYSALAVSASDRDDGIERGEDDDVEAD